MSEVEVALSVAPNIHIVGVFGICADAPDGRLRMVMEYCEHGSLRSHLSGMEQEVRGGYQHCHPCET